MNLNLKHKPRILSMPQQMAHTSIKHGKTVTIALLTSIYMFAWLRGQNVLSLKSPGSDGQPRVHFHFFGIGAPCDWRCPRLPIDRCCHYPRAFPGRLVPGSVWKTLGGDVCNSAAMACWGITVRGMREGEGQGCSESVQITGLHKTKRIE